MSNLTEERKRELAKSLRQAESGMKKPKGCPTVIRKTEKEEYTVPPGKFL
jgi:hypothetical protein